METSAISYRVADFLKQYPPFQSMEEEDLIALATHGRVKFHETGEFILWQGTELAPWVFIIQQGTVAIWLEAENGDRAADRLIDIRGAGDIVGIDRYHGFTINQHSVKAASDVVLYALPAEQFGEMLKKYPHAEKYVAAHASVAGNYLVQEQRRGAQETYVYDTLAPRDQATCESHDPLSYAASLMSTQGATAVAIMGPRGQLEGVITERDLVRAMSLPGFDPSLPVSAWMRTSPPILEPSATVADCVLAMAAHRSPVAVITERRSSQYQQHRVVDMFDLTPAFGDHPASILREIAYADSTHSLRTLHQRARMFALDRLISPASVEWIATYLHYVDVGILRRISYLIPPPGENYSWCFYGAAGRCESLTAILQRAILILPHPVDGPLFQPWYEAVQHALRDSGYAGRDEHFTSQYSCASVGDWATRYQRWISDPIENRIHQVRHMFDLRPVQGNQALWDSLHFEVRQALDASESFVRMLAHDCLASLPPLTFFADAVVEESGQQSAVFHLQNSALRPLVDVGRVFGIAAGRALGTSTLERFRLARTLLPEQDAIFREAADTLRVVLYLQARSGLREGDRGSDIDPALLSHHERQLLKSGFRSIHRLLEFTADGDWLERG